MVLGTISARVSLDTVDFTNNMAKLKRELKTAKTEFKAASEGVDSYGTGLNKTGNQVEALNRQINIQKKIMESNADAFKKASDGTDKITKAQQQAQERYIASRTEIERLTNQIDELTIAEREAGDAAQAMAAQQELANTKLGKASAFIDQTGAKLQSWGKGLTTAGRNVENFGNTWTMAGVVTGAAIAGVTKQYIDWENGVVSMNKTIEASPAEFEKLTDSVRELALEIPIAQGELAKLAALGAQLGIENDSLLEFTETVAALGVATDLTAEDAATMMAQFANITNMDQGEFDRLASSITEVGNNTATTESEVMRMALQLAGAGEAAGLSESEIVGVSAALSSLGIEAERGGSTFSKLMIEMAVASETGLTTFQALSEQTGMTFEQISALTSAGGNDFKAFAESVGMSTDEIKSASDSFDALQGYAEVAGVSVEEFAEKFGTNAVDAIALFIDGLASSEEQGESTIAILDELGINEIRLRDTLLRTSGAQGLLNETIALSNDAWSENTALTKEAGLFYESTESKLKIFGNKARDVAIDLGEALLPALIDILDNSEPLIDGARDLAEWFGKLDDKTKGLVVKMLGLVVVGGPIVSFFGRLMQATGFLATGLGKLASPIKKVFDTLNASKGITSGASAGIKTLTGNVLGFNGGIATMLPQVGLAVLAIAGVGLAYKGIVEPAMEASAEVDKFGMDVSEAMTNTVTEMQNTDVEFENAMTSMKIGAAGAGDDIKSAFKTMVDGTKTEVAGLNEDMLTEFSKLPPEVAKVVEKSVQSSIAGNEDILAEVDGLMEQANNIFAKAIDENRQLSEDEMRVIDDLYTRVGNLRIEAMAETNEEASAARMVMSEEMDKWDSKQLSNRRSNLKDMVQAERESYNEQKEILNDWLNSGDITFREYEEAMEGLKESNTSNLAEISGAMIEWGEAMGFTEQAIKNTLDGMGLSYEDGMQAISDAVEEAKNSVIRDTDELEGATLKATDAWNNLMLENKIVDIDTNQADYAITKFAETQAGWDSLVFQSKFAELTTNQKEFLAEILQGNEKWYDLTWLEREATMTTNTPETVKAWLEAEGLWDGLKMGHKQALMYTNSPETIQQALIDAGIWDQLSFETQMMLTQTNAGLKVQEAMTAMGEWEALTVEEKMFWARSNVDTEVLGLMDYHGLWTDTNFMDKLAQIDTNSPDAMEQFMLLIEKWTDSDLENKEGNVTVTEAGLEKTTQNINDYNREVGIMPREVTGGIHVESNAGEVTPYVEKWNEVNAQIEEDTNSNVTTGAPLATENTEKVKGWNEANLATIDTSTTADTSTNAPVPTSLVKAWNDAQENTKSTSTSADTKTNADTNTPKVDNWTRALQNAPEWKTSTLETVTRKIVETGTRVVSGLVNGFNRNEKGTNFHSGGLALVNDQAGSMFRELVTLPGGKSFIPEGRNVMLDLPRGSKVLKASLTKAMFPGIPQYKDGIGYDNINIPFKPLSNSNTSNSSDVYNITLRVETKQNIDHNEANKIADMVTNAIKRKEQSRKVARGG